MFLSFLCLQKHASASHDIDSALHTHHVYSLHFRCTDLHCIMA
uniref:Uncharacterized protein n=1 Tax=Arundo donax TaxID=35708 RepID=A0A0A9CD16_ARUDO